MQRTIAPTAAVRQLSTHHGGESLLSLLVKRTYRVEPSGICAPVDELPLTTDLKFAEHDPNLLEADLDLIPLKPRTDVVVLGHAYAYGSLPRIEVSVRVDGYQKTIAVTGDRRCTLGAAGRVIFASPQPFETMPLNFARAYGGRDSAAEALHGHCFGLLAPYLTGTALDAANQSPYLYPRNPCGKGYLIEAARAAVEVCDLPNLEDPQHLLTPAGLASGHTSRWIYMPIPQGLGWVNWGWFPRAAFGGLRQEHARERAPIPEVERGLLPRSVLDCEKANDLPMEHLLRFGNGAPLDLQLPHLRGGETVELSHIHPTMRQWKFRLPGPPSRMCVDGRQGKLRETRPILQTVIVEPDLARLSLVWRGSAAALRPYLPEELETMPLLVVP